MSYYTFQQEPKTSGVYVLDPVKGIGHLVIIDSDTELRGADVAELLGEGEWVLVGRVTEDLSVGGSAIQKFREQNPLAFVCLHTDGEVGLLHPKARDITNRCMMLGDKTINEVVGISLARMAVGFIAASLLREGSPQKKKAKKVNNSTATGWRSYTRY